MKIEIGKRITKIREDMGMTKESFAKILGISGQYLGLIEHGKNYISIEKLKLLCDISGLTADYILFGDETDIIINTKILLKKFDKDQITAGCKMLKKMALLIKGTDED